MKCYGRQDLHAFYYIDCEKHCNKQTQNNCHKETIKKLMEIRNEVS